MNPDGSADVSRSDAKRTHPSDWVSSSSPSGRQIHMSLPRGCEVPFGSTRLVGPSSRITRLPVCGWNATLSYMARTGLPGMKRSTIGIVPVAGAGTAALGGSSVRHMISEFTAEFSTVLTPTWLMRPVLAQHARNTPFSPAIGSMSMSSGR
jgi:hypothetical protein